MTARKDRPRPRPRGGRVSAAEWREIRDAMPVAQQRRLAKRARAAGQSALGMLIEHPDLCVPGAKG